MTDPKPIPEEVLELIEPLLAADIIAPVELPDLPETWQIYGNQQVIEDLNRLGFVQQPQAQGPGGRDQKPGK